MFDCGPGAVRRLLRSGVSSTALSHLFLTHLHYDHCVDYGYLVLNRWDHGSGKIPELLLALKKIISITLGAEDSIVVVAQD